MDYKGLNEQQVQESRKKFGSNKLPESKPTTFWKEFKETFSDPMIRILLVIVAVMLVMFAFGYAEIFDPIGTVVAILIVATVTAKNGVASDLKYRQLKERSKKETCKVYRSGQIHVLDMDDVVVGDKILLQSGDRVPADGILIAGHLKVNNMALNGESCECQKSAGNENTKFPDKITTADTFNDKHLLFRGEILYDGEGVLDVRKVGTQTEMGKMALEMSEDNEPDSPLKVKLSKLANQISTFGYIGAAVITLLYIVYFVMQAGGVSAYLANDLPTIIQNIVSAVSLAVVIIVCAVPEGLPLMIAIVLMQNTSKMLEHNVLVRKAEGIETAGSLNILFSDKTGTITKGQLEVVDFMIADGQTVSLESNKSLNQLVSIAVSRNTQSMFDDNGQVVGGNATDQAMVRMLGKERFDTYKDLPIEDSQTFSSQNKFSQAYVSGKTFYKGAPEKLLASAKTYVDANGTVQSFDDSTASKLNRKIDELAEKAMRILAIGYSEHKMVEDKINNDLTLIGLVAIRDDVRPEARDAIAEVQAAGIQVVMITGDRKETAVAIAQDAGLYHPNTSDVALTSNELNEMSDAEVKKIIPNIRVISRALPTDKSRMVRLCQELNLVCGMTGDGVNDSPALKRADVGFAMGSGTEAAKEASKIVILDDNFKSIKDAILYGRTIYHNILKFCLFQLVINVAAVVISAISPFIGVEEPLKVTHLLFVNLVMDGLGAMMLGNEPALEKYMTEKPRRRDESIISKTMAKQIGTMAVWFVVISMFYLKSSFVAGLFQTQAQHLTGYFVLFIWAALMNGFNVRDNGTGIFKRLNENPNFLKIMSIIIAVQLAIVYAGIIPFAPFQWIGDMFSCTPIPLTGLACVAVFAITMIPVDLIRKMFVNRKPEGAKKAE